MRDAVLRRDGVALAEAAHTLSGLASNFSAEPTFKSACKLETMAERGEFSDTENALANLEEEANRLATVILEILQEEQGSVDRQPSTPASSAGRPIRIITADVQELVRNGIRLTLQSFDDNEAVGEASSGAEAVGLFDKLKPEVVLMDLRMPNVDGVAATRTIRRRCPDTKVLTLTVRERQVLGLLAKGMRNNEIAEQINKSPYTVRHYVSEMISKLGANNRAEAAVIAVKHGLTD